MLFRSKVEQKPTTEVSNTPTVHQKTKFTYQPKREVQVAKNSTVPLPPMSVQVRPTKAEEPIPEFEVKGVIIDDQAMVVLKMGEKSLYKSVGEKLQGGVLIEKVTQEAVTFRIGKERRVLAPGQTFRAIEPTTFTTTNE